MADPTVPPDLASILATLAQFAPQQQEQQQAPPPAATTPTITDPRLQRRQQQNAQSSFQPSHEKHPKQVDHASSSYNPQAAVFQPVKPQGRSTPQPPRTSAPQQEQQTIIDPATITEWSAGLRCVTKIAAQNPMFADKIRGLIKDQRSNEMAWYQNRQTVKQMQAKRSASANELQNILKSVGGIGINTPQTPEEKAAELAAFDQKLYKAQLAMNESMSQVLKHLGVPFFGTHAALILPDHDGNGDQNEKKDEQIVDAQGERPKWSPRVTAKELMELKRKMVGYLEDMYKA
ncbi:hypothetical protein D6C86_08280 [Aureobasidium pullulans]|uniref:Uncharacterized protein n=1 Tax=Aureobasidium pullulans TaxID=5580 RepID=A0A4S9VVB1_AURPU|nr:hypothetical protein D6C94_08857 [Aureobasidium pullulans]THZ43011.1 hypothetical protein D6C87_04616 [Aureobasidium pullulans]THZ55916.1 hypothetical protein D6C86_08280 [Aureobasidium pullulans]THZ87509.1 hypothetical protein D6C88_05165 [Aureobasidium pullulans]